MNRAGLGAASGGAGIMGGLDSDMDTRAFLPAETLPGDSVQSISKKVEVGERFELSWGYEPQLAFEASAFNHSAIPPRGAREHHLSGRLERCEPGWPSRQTRSGWAVPGTSRLRTRFIWTAVAQWAAMFGIGLSAGVERWESLRVQSLAVPGGRASRRLTFRASS